jgi:hypothetical protein
MKILLDEEKYMKDKIWNLQMKKLSQIWKNCKQNQDEKIENR